MRVVITAPLTATPNVVPIPGQVRLTQTLEGDPAGVPQPFEVTFSLEPIHDIWFIPPGGGQVKVLPPMPDSVQDTEDRAWDLALERGPGTHLASGEAFFIQQTLQAPPDPDQVASVLLSVL